MKRTLLSVTATLAVVAATFVLLPTKSSAQDAPSYTMFMTEYMRVRPGHQAEFGSAMAEHNKKYHSGGGSQHQYMYFVVTGSTSGEFVSVTGPMTFSDMDKPQAEGHGEDWATVLTHAVSRDRSFWRLDDELSISVDNNAGPTTIQRVRYFHVKDNAAFRRVQGQLKAVILKMGANRDRALYRRQGATRDGHEWAIVTGYQSWSEMDQPREGNFRETFNSIYGEDAWPKYQSDWDDAAGEDAAEDEFWAYVEQLSGTPPTNE